MGTPHNLKSVINVIKTSSTDFEWVTVHVNKWLKNNTYSVFVHQDVNEYEVSRLSNMSQLKINETLTCHCSSTSMGSILTHFYNIYL